MKFYFPKMISMFIVSSLFFSACGGGSGDEPIVDTTKPTITIENPTDGQSILRGGAFPFKGTFTDDTELKKVVFSLQVIQPTAAYGATGIGDSPWSPADFIINLSGKTQSVDEAIFDASVPSNVYTGAYELTVTCTDAADNAISETVNVVIN